MKKFARHCTLREVKERCAALGIVVDTTKHDRDFSDFITLSGALAGVGFVVIFSVFNGTFFGEVETGRRFCETSKLDDEPWYAALLSLLFVEAVHG